MFPPRWGELNGYNITAGTDAYQNAPGSGAITKITYSKAQFAKLFNEVHSGHKPTLPPSVPFI